MLRNKSKDNYEECMTRPNVHQPHGPGYFHPNSPHQPTTQKHMEEEGHVAVVALSGLAKGGMCDG